jgi:hypothetical protein
MNIETLSINRKKYRCSDFGFITEIIQRGRIRPAKFIHCLKMPTELYKELRDSNVIIPEDYFIDERAFFEFKNEFVIISFVYLFNCEDLHRQIDHYLVVKFSGSYPIERTGISKMNFDRKIEPVRYVKTKRK